MCGRQGILQERMRNRSCVGCELILDFLFNWISLVFYVFAVNIRFGWGYVLLVLCNFFVLHLQLMIREAVKNYLADFFR